MRRHSRTADRCRQVGHLPDDADGLIERPRSARSGVPHPSCLARISLPAIWIRPPLNIHCDLEQLEPKPQSACTRQFAHPRARADWAVRHDQGSCNAFQRALAAAFAAYERELDGALLRRIRDWRPGS